MTLELPSPCSVTMPNLITVAQTRCARCPENFFFISWGLSRRVIGLRDKFPPSLDLVTTQNLVTLRRAVWAYAGVPKLGQLRPSPLGLRELHRWECYRRNSITAQKTRIRVLPSVKRWIIRATVSTQHTCVIDSQPYRQYSHITDSVKCPCSVFR